MGHWPVLHDRPTVASLHRSVRAPRSRSVPHDSLDLHLLSCYQHNREIFPDTSDVIRHPSRLEELALYVPYIVLMISVWWMVLMMLTAGGWELTILIEQAFETSKPKLRWSSFLYDHSTVGRQSFL